MKRIAVSIILLAFCVLASARTLTTSESAKHIGENETVCGVVAGVHTATRSKGEPTFINLDKPYPNQVFTILIWGSDLAKFTLAPSTWDGKRVCATGTITSYHGVPEIVARNPKQVEFTR